MRNIINCFSLLSLNFILISCGGGDFTERSELEGLRVLSISANTPEVNASAPSTVILSPVISYVDGGNTTLDYSWEACPDPGIDFGADINCDSSPSTLKQVGSNTFSTSSLSGSSYTGLATSLSVNITPAILAYFSNLDSDLQFNGVDYIVVLKYSDQNSDAKIDALKRIKLTSKTTGLNVNESFGDIIFNDSILSAYPTVEGIIKISSPTPGQTYSKQTNVGLKSFEEEMYISWYSSTGEYLFNRTDTGEDNTFTPEGSSGVFVVVYRDGRGGVFTKITNF